MKASEIVHAIQTYCPEAKDCSWEEHKGMGYFKATVNGIRRVIAIPLEAFDWPTYMIQPKRLPQVLAEIMDELRK